VRDSEEEKLSEITLKLEQTAKNRTWIQEKPKAQEDT